MILKNSILGLISILVITLELRKLMLILDGKIIHRITICLKILITLYHIILHVSWGMMTIADPLM